MKKHFQTQTWWIETETPPLEKNISCWKIETRDLWVSNPVRFSLGQCDLVLEKGHFLEYSEKIFRLIISPSSHLPVKPFLNVLLNPVLLIKFAKSFFYKNPVFSISS